MSLLLEHSVHVSRARRKALHNLVLIENRLRVRLRRSRRCSEKLEGGKPPVTIPGMRSKAAGMTLSAIN